MFWKVSYASHCFCLKPTSQCTFTERILCSIVCLNVYNVLKNFFRKPLLPLEAHTLLSLILRYKAISASLSLLPRAHTLFNCMFECVECFEKLLLRVIASASSPPPSVLSQSANFVQSYIWMCKMFWKNFFWKLLLLLEAHHSA